MNGSRLNEDGAAMLPPWLIRPMRGEEVEEIFALVTRVFNQFEAPGYSPEGVCDFFLYANSASAVDRADSHAILVGEIKGVIKGMIEVRKPSHISLLFVDAAIQGYGFGRALYEAGVVFLLQESPELEKVTVNSSPYAVGFYKKMGFKAITEEQVIHGIRFTPMERLLKTQYATKGEAEVEIREG